MMYPLYNYKKREDVANSPAGIIAEEAKELLHYLNRSIYALTSQYDEVVKTPSVSENLNKLSRLHKTSSDILNKPSFVISTIGTTSSGKSTFVNALLGSKLSPMSADELSVGSLRFDYNEALKNNCRITVDSQISNRFWNNGTVDKNFTDSYNYIKNIMEVYRSEFQNETLSPPHIKVETSYLVGNNPVFLGLDPNVQLEIMELPWMIIDSENLSFIADKVKSSLVVFLIDYTVLFNKETRETNLLFKKLMDMKQDVGNTDAVIFVLNKIDLKNFDDDELEIALNKCKREIQKRLNISGNINVVPLNSLLMFYLQTAYLSYENGNFAASYNPDSNIELTEFEKVHFEIIKDSLRKCFKDQAKVISDIQDSSEENEKMILEIKQNLKKDKIPAYPVFKKLWQEGMKRSGTLNLFQEIKSKSKENMRNLLLYSPLNEVINETNSFLLGVKEQIRMGKENDKKMINSEETHVINVFTEMKDKIESFRNDIQEVVTQSLKELKGMDSRIRSKAVENLDIGQIEEIVPALKAIVRKENISPIEKAFTDEIRPDILSSNLVRDNAWNKDLAERISEDFDFLRMKLFSEKKYIDEGRRFSYSSDDTYEKQKLEDIENRFNELCKSIVDAMDERMKFEIQNTIDELSIRVNRWLNKKVREIYEMIDESLKKFDKVYNFDIPNTSQIKSTKFQGVFNDKILLRPELHSDHELVQSTVDKPKKAWYQFWINDETSVIEQQKEFTIYSSVSKQSNFWFNSLSSVDHILWNIICEHLENFFQKAFNNYDLALSDMYKQINNIISEENNKIESLKTLITTKWSNIDNIYLQINKITDKMYDISETPKPDRTIYTREESETVNQEENTPNVEYDDETLLEKVDLSYEEYSTNSELQTLESEPYQDTTEETRVEKDN